MTELATNRRKHPRYRVRFACTIAPAEEMGETTSIGGRVHDVSVGGMAVVLPSLDFARQQLLGYKQALRLAIDLPVGAIEIRAIPLHYRAARADEVEAEDVKGSSGEDAPGLIGLSIAEMTSADQARYNELLSSLGGEENQG